MNDWKNYNLKLKYFTFAVLQIDKNRLFSLVSSMWQNSYYLHLVIRTINSKHPNWDYKYTEFQVFEEAQRDSSFRRRGSLETLVSDRGTRCSVGDIQGQLPARLGTTDR